MTDQNKLIRLKDYNKIKQKLGDDLIKCLADVRGSENNIVTLPDWKPPEKNEDGGDKIVVIKEFGDGWWTQKYIGLLRVKDKTIYIGSRFDKDNGENNFFTNYILSKALSVKGLLFPEMQPNMGLDRMMEQLLAIVFVNQIRVAQKRGLFRMYRTFERNDEKVRGKIDVSRHINLNPLFNGKIAYSYREYTADNDINRLIFTAFSMLEKKYKVFMKGLLNSNRSVRECMMQMGNIVQQASQQEIRKLLRRKNQKIRHSVYKEWEAVRQTAVLILQHMGVNVARSDKNTINGILVDMTEMWELYLESILKGVGEEVFGELKAQDIYRVLCDNNKEYNEEDGRRDFKPDFYWKKEEDVLFVADAKYKNSWEKIAKNELIHSKKDKWREPEFDVREDVFQVMSYMYTLDCRHGAVICPVTVEAAKSPLHCRYTISKKTDDKFHLFALAIPQNCKNYDDFKAQMKESETNLREALAEVET